MRMSDIICIEIYFDSFIYIEYKLYKASFKYFYIIETDIFFYNKHYIYFQLFYVDLKHKTFMQYFIVFHI